MSATEQGDSVIGHDPLAWIAQEEDEAAAVASSAADAPDSAASAMDNTPEPPQEEAPKDVQQPAVETAIALAEHAASGEIVVLDGDMGIANIHDWHATFREALLQHKKVTIQAASLNHVDTAALQLLYAVQREATASEVALVWQDVPDAIRKTANIIALDDALGW